MVAGNARVRAFVRVGALLRECGPRYMDVGGASVSEDGGVGTPCAHGRSPPPPRGRWPAHRALFSPPVQVAYNHVHDYGQGILSDFGCVYATTGDPGLTGSWMDADVHHNLCTDGTHYPEVLRLCASVRVYGGAQYVCACVCPRACAGAGARACACVRPCPRPQAGESFFGGARACRHVHQRVRRVSVCALAPAVRQCCVAEPMTAIWGEGGGVATVSPASCRSAHSPVWGCGCAVPGTGGRLVLQGGYGGNGGYSDIATSGTRWSFNVFANVTGRAQVCSPPLPSRALLPPLLLSFPGLQKSTLWVWWPTPRGPYGPPPLCCFLSSQPLALRVWRRQG
jgi:hypothetical protein